VPQFSERSAGVLDRLATVARERSVALDGWTVFLNNWHLANAHPECAVQTPFGNPDRTWLSPSHPAVIEYCAGLVAAAGASGLVDVLQCEAVYHVPFPCHPVDRVNISVILSDLDLWLGGICLSEHSLRLIADCGGDGERAAASLRSHLAERLAGRGRALPKTGEGVHEVLGPDAQAVLDGRALAITRVLEAMAEQARRAGIRLEWEEDVASWESFFSGVQEGPLSSQRQWEVGVDRDAVARLLDEAGLLLYFADEDRFREELADATRTFGKVPRVLHRPYSPDVADAETLARRIAILDEAGVPESVLYMQSLMPQGTQEMVGEAVRLASTTRAG
jgi:hypothetical protein